MKNNNEATTLTDRLALGFGSGVIAFITGTILWVSFYSIFVKYGEFDLVIPFYYVWVFTFTGFIIGALTLQNYFINILAPIWSFIYKYIVVIFH